MGWVAHAADLAHSCEMPEGGHLGDLWRCDECHALWRIGLACDLCDWYRTPSPHGGTCMVGLEWRPATWWQRLIHRRS